MPDDDTPYGGYVGKPDPALVFAAILISVIFSIWQYYTTDRVENEKKRRLKDGKTNSNKSLAEHSKLFNKKEIIRVDDSVYCAIGFGLANCIMIEGKISILFVICNIKNYSGEDLTTIFITSYSFIIEPRRGWLHFD